MTTSQRERRNNEFRQNSEITKEKIFQNIPVAERDPLRISLQKLAMKLAKGYYVTEEVPRKVVTVEMIDDRKRAFQKIEVVPVKKYIRPNAVMAKFLMEILTMEPANEKNIWEVVFTGDALAEHYIDD